MKPKNYIQKNYRFNAINGVLSLSLSLSLSLLLILSFNKLSANEVFKSKAAGMGPNIFKQYSMTKSNTNDGFIYSGTTKNPSGIDVIHIIKTDFNFSSQWSYYYEVSSSTTLNSTKICQTNDNQGYFISGYFVSSSINYPIVIKIDNNGNITDNVRLEHAGVYLDVEPTSDGGCIAVGYQSNSLNLNVTSNGRRGLITKFDNTLAIDWSKCFHAQFRKLSDNYFHDLAENVTVINSSFTNNQDYYFVMGGVTDSLGVNLAAGPYYNANNAYYCYIDNSGGLVYQNTFKKDVYIYDACYFPNEHKIYFTGKWDYWDPAASLIIGDISLAGGILNNLKFGIGPINPTPSAHIPIGYKIECENDEIRIYGNVREIVTGNPLNNFHTMIPFRLILERISYNPIEYIINHSNLVNTEFYDGESPGWLNAWVGFGAASIYYNRMPANFVPEMGLSFINDYNQRIYTYINYYNNFKTPIRFDLHFISTDFNGECYPLERTIEIYNLNNFTSVNTFFVEGNENEATLLINRLNLNLDDENCN